MFWSCCDCSWRMRRSAISCWCSLLAARAGAAVSTMAPASRTPKILCVIGSLCGDDEMRAAILLVRALVMARVERELLAVAHSAESIGRNAERHQVGARGDRAALPQCQIVLGGPAFVAVTFDRDGPRRVAFQDCRVLIEGLLAGRAQVAAVELEEDRFERRCLVQIVE